MRIAVVGSYGVGLTMRVPRAPLPGETLSGGCFASGHGGKGSNQAVAAARLGARVSLCTALGRDAFADAARVLWSEEGVDASAVVDVDAATMVGVILVEESGENRIVIAQGALAELSAADVDRFAPHIAAADMLVVGLEIPVEPVVRALEIARSHGVRTLLNPAPAPAFPLPEHIWPMIDVLTPNRTEAAVLAGANPGADLSLRACVRELRNRYHGLVVLTLGAEGAFVDDGDRGLHVPPVSPRRVVDTTGAGDQFTAALAVALCAGDPPVAAAQYAAAAGAHCVSIPEVVPALARAGDVAALLPAGAPDAD